MGACERKFSPCKDECCSGVSGVSLSAVRRQSVLLYRNPGPSPRSSVRTMPLLQEEPQQMLPVPELRGKQNSFL